MKWKSLEKPRKLDWDQESLTSTYGKVMVEPFERGYGMTIGNSIRRILLSSLPGAAITAVKMDGALHEFSTVKGIMEDVTQILLNLKQVRITLNSDEPRWVKLLAEGEREVRARDIETDPAIEILTPDQHIATLNDRHAKLALEMYVEVGHGYIPAEKLKREDQTVGEIPLDAIFSPVKKVRFEVENTRVGQMTDYERLNMEIWTDGRTKPQEALDEAVTILKEHLVIFAHEQEAAAPDVKETADQEKERLRELLNKSVEELEFSVRSANCLKNANIKTIGQLVQKSESEMLKYRNFGRKSLNEIKEVLTDMNLGLGMNLEELAEKQG